MTTIPSDAARPTTPTSRHDAGFTLIEVLLAVAITAAVMITVATTFHVMLNARDVVDDLSESTEAGPRILNLIERDLHAMWTFNVHNNAVFRGRDMDVGGRDADRIDFLCTTDAVGYVLDTRGQPRKPTLCEVGYWFKPNPRYRDVFEMWRREDPMVDNDLITQGSFQLVHDRIKSFKVTYFETSGHGAEELNEWDSSVRDRLPDHMKVEFTIERRRGSRNIVSDVEVDDFEGAEQSYVRYFSFDQRMNDILQAGVARVPVFPIEPEAEASDGTNGGGPVAGGGGGGGGKTTTTVGKGDVARAGEQVTKGRLTETRTGGGRGTSSGGAAAPAPRGGGQGVPPGFDLGDLLRGGGGGGGGGFFGGGR